MMYRMVLSLLSGELDTCSKHKLKQRRDETVQVFTGFGCAFYYWYLRLKQNSETIMTASVLK